MTFGEKLKNLREAKGLSQKNWQRRWGKPAHSIQL